MEVFSLTLTQMLMMAIFIVTGIILHKIKLLPENADVALSRLQVYVFSPAQAFFAMSKHCTIKTFTENSYLILCGTVIIVALIILAYPLSTLFVRNPERKPEIAYQRNVYKYALAFANYSYMGNFLILGLWGTEMLFKYSMFKLPLDILCSTWAIYILIPKDHSKGGFMSIIKSLFTAPILGVILGIIAGLLGLAKYIPDFVNTALENASNCMGPNAMLIAGFVIGGYNILELFKNKKVYIMTALRLFIIPAAVVLILRYFNLSADVITFALIAFASPLGMNTIVFPATFGGETHTGASMVITSTILSVITIPILFNLFVTI